MNPSFLSNDNMGLRLSLQERGQLRPVTQLPPSLFLAVKKVSLIDIVVSN
jgi:hypothetical protein